MALDILGPANAPNSVTVRPGDSRAFGGNDTWYKDCTSPSINDGTKLQASPLNGILGQLRSLIRGNGQTAGAADIVAQNNADDGMALKSVQHLLQRGKPSWALDTGAANAYVVTLSPAAPELAAGMTIRVKIANDNTGASTIAVNGLAAAAIKTVAGQDLQRGMLVAGQIAELAYDGTNFQLISIFSEKVVFTPRANIATSALASIPRGVFTTHDLTLASSSGLTPVVSTNSFTLPNGVYLFAYNGATRTNFVINNSAYGHVFRLLQNGNQLGFDYESFYLFAGQDQTTYPRLVLAVTAVSTDVFQLQSTAGSSYPADYNGANASAGLLNVIRIGS